MENQIQCSHWAATNIKEKNSLSLSVNEVYSIVNTKLYCRFYICYHLQTKFAKVMASQVSVCPRGDMLGRWACMAQGHAWQGGMAKRHAWLGGACVVGGRAWQERWSLQRAVRILLECILVENKSVPYIIYEYTIAWNILNMYLLLKIHVPFRIVCMSYKEPVTFVRRSREVRGVHEEVQPAAVDAGRRRLHHQERRALLDVRDVHCPRRRDR